MERYPWELADATWFVLTGEVPAMPPARGQYKVKRGNHYAYGQITLTVMPWVPAKTVSELYRKVQRQALGGDNQPLKEKALNLVRFVMEHVYPVGLSSEERRRLGQRLIDEWNQTEWVREQPQDERPKDAQKWRRHRAYEGPGRTRQFWRDFSRQLQAVAYQPLSRRHNGSSSDGKGW